MSQVVRLWVRQTRPELFKYGPDEPGERKFILKATGKPLAKGLHVDFWDRFKRVTGVRNRKLAGLESVRAYAAASRAIRDYCEVNLAVFNSPVTLGQVTGLWWDKLGEGARADLTRWS